MYFHVGFNRSFEVTYRTPFQAMEDVEDMMIAAAEVCNLFGRSFLVRRCNSPVVVQATAEVCDFRLVVLFVFPALCRTLTGRRSGYGGGMYAFSSVLVSRLSPTVFLFHFCCFS